MSINKRDRLVNMKMEFNQYVKAEAYVTSLIASLPYGSLEWADSIQLLDKVSREKQELQAALNHATV